METKQGLERKIIHVDMDAFYASVEQRDNPDLQGKPVVVGGQPNTRGVVASASYEARKYGIRSAMSCKKAYQLCPKVHFVSPQFKKYREASDTIRALFLEVTDKVEPLSLDEAYLDVTENKLGEPLARKIALHLKMQIQERTGLTASAGVGPNKFIAKIASDLKKPNGLVVIPPSKVEGFLESLAVERLWGVGPATTRLLHSLNLKTAGDIRKKTSQDLEKKLGKFGNFLHQLAWGNDPRPVEPHGEPKSRGTETTFERDVMDLYALGLTLRTQADELSESLCEDGYLAKTVTLKLRYSDFKTITRSKTLSMATNDALTFENIGIELLEKATHAGRRPVRLIGLAATGLMRKDAPIQLCWPF